MLWLILLWLVQSRTLWHSNWFLFFWKWIKRVLHWFTGCSELERLCLEWLGYLDSRNAYQKYRVPSSRTFSALAYHFNILKPQVEASELDEYVKARQLIPVTPVLLLRLERALFHSTHLQIIRRQLESKNTLELYPLYQMLIDAKSPIQHPLVPTLLYQTLLCEHATFRVLHELDHRAMTKYDPNQKSHEKRLLELWTLLMPDVPLLHRHSKQWERLGFQGTDPATDFRGVGVLGLDMLWYCAKKYPEHARTSLLISHRESRYLPWSCVGIQILAMLLGMLRRRECQYYLYDFLLSNSAFTSTSPPTPTTTSNDESTMGASTVPGQWHEWESWLSGGEVKNADLWHTHGDSTATALKEAISDLFSYLLFEFDPFFDDMLQRDRQRSGTASPNSPASLMTAMTTSLTPAVMVYPKAMEAYRARIDYQVRCLWNGGEVLTWSRVRTRLMESSGIETALSSSSSSS